jgi:two-component system NtrC family sensor kinase
MHFQTKVLVPTVLVMALLQGILMWVVNQRFTRQFSEQGRRSLTTAAMLFSQFEQSRAKTQLERCRGVARPSGVRSLLQKVVVENNTPGMLPTIQRLLKDELIPQTRADLAVYSRPDGVAFARAAREQSLVNSPGFTNILSSVHLALTEPPPAADQLPEGNVDVVQIGEHLFHIASIPVFVDDAPVGVLTFGNELTETVAREIPTPSQITFLSGGTVVASTMNDPAIYPDLARIFTNAPKAATPVAANREDIRGEPYLFSAGHFKSLVPDPATGYLLLYSLDKPLQELYATQRMLLTVGLVAILFGSGTVWLLVRKLTQPLRDLRDSAEAVGRGELEHKVEVNSNDECGELAETFNEMTSNLRASRAELEKTVESLKNTQAQLVQREKLSAIGEFVAGVTHELNNPLTVVIGIAELLRQIDNDEKHRKHLDTIVAGAQRCHKIVRSLLSFARQHPSERKLVNVNDLIEATLTFVQYEMRTSNIEIQRQLSPDLPPVHADPHQLQQVFLNIVNNARQAMEPKNSGILKVHSSRYDHHVQITLRDNGPGISAENLKKLFTPFFTTKEVGKGTGLGLSVSYGIIHDHGGSIEVQSAVGEGTAFIIRLPVAPMETAQSRESEKKDGPLTIDGVGKRVLAIDDEEHILELIRESLTVSGYSVDTARDGESALDLLRRGRYDVTLCDWKMPGLNGRQIYERLLQMNPAAASRVVFMTGDVINENVREFLDSHKATCIAKPFSLEEFREVVGKISRSQPAG